MWYIVFMESEKKILEIEFYDEHAEVIDYPDIAEIREMVASNLIEARG
jgi:hypothetical protein